MPTEGFANRRFAEPSAAGSLSGLAGLRRPRRIYVRMNNTNPMLNEVGPEYRQGRELGWEIAEDAWQFDL